MQFIVSGQDTIWVKEGDKKYMINTHSRWIFKDHLPDGHYCSYDGERKGYISVEFTLVNGKKEGVENRYFSFSKEKYATVEWHNGMKNGVETHYNGNNTIWYTLNFKDNVLNGYFEINWSEGEKHYQGFYKNGYADSIWTYYENSKFGDSSGDWMSKQIRYINGRSFLISAWNKQGHQAIANGKGILIDSSYYNTTTVYLNGMKNGKQVLTTLDGMLIREETYKDDMLINEVLYYDSNRFARISEWSYSLSPIIDTQKRWIDTYITDIFYNEISFNYSATPNGYWVAYYPNGVKTYEGHYDKGMRVGIWGWNYENGMPRITADYSTGTWQHFDSTGKLVSNFAGEYITLLTDDNWFLNQKFEDQVIILSKRNKKMVTPRLVFSPDGMLENNDYLECGKDIGRRIDKYTLHADMLTIITTGNKEASSKVYKYRVISATDKHIKLKRLK